MEEIAEILKKGGDELGLSFSSEQIDKFFIYLEELKRWNRRLNLTGLKKDEEIVVKHFLDSLSCAELIEDFDSKMIDVGTGAGFPSLPLKIYQPKIPLTLLESIRKKVTFLNYLVKALELKKVRIIWSRAEEWAQGKERESYHYVVCRALASLRVSLEYTLPFLEIGGCLIVQKGPKLKGEIKTSSKALSILGGKVDRILHLRLPLSGDKRYLLRIEKVRATPPDYPRRVGIPSKSPL
jgi:16S rRNA (guanine527-N7)-methyltransferase